MPKSNLTRAILLIALSAAIPSIGLGLNLLNKSARVTVASEASESYQKIQSARSPGEIETIHFMEGQFFPGLSKDKSLDRVSFQEIVEALAPNLAKQNYIPGDDITTGDLLLVVHYGVAAVDTPWDELMGITSAEEEAMIYGSDVGSTNSETGEFELNSDVNYDAQPSNQVPGAGSNARLLGYDRSLRKKNLTTAEEFDLRTDLEEDRYFIIVMAYDCQKLLNEKEFELQWTTRFSVRTPGTNFEEAHFALSRAAAPFFGKNLDGLERAKVPFGKDVDVSIGELEVLEEDVPRNKN
ncbi:MAG: hypothetical protein SynsKO_12760 [Synoicihabitans sp.]